MSADYNALLDKLDPIKLEEMSAIRLMNRTDSKFLTNEDQLRTLLGMVSNDYLVQEIDGKRMAHYSTLYLDDADNTMYLNHHNKRLTRQKVRVRSYVDSNLDFFEIKLKNNHGRTKKKRMEIAGPDRWNQADTAGFLEQHAMLPIPLSGLQPKITNDFQRITLVNKAHTERLTIDSGLSFHNVESGIDRIMDRLVIIEVKRDGNTESPIMDMLRQLRIQPSGFSKYCIGMALTLPGIKRNNFNLRLRKIEKLTQYYV